MKKHTILFLAADPTGAKGLVLDRRVVGREAQAIQKELQIAGYGDCFEFVTWWAVQPLDLLRKLRELKPTVVHFAGHGDRGAGENRFGPAQRRDIAGDSHVQGCGESQRGLFFQGPDGCAQLVTTHALEEAFGVAGQSVKLVVLNACYSEAQAEALLAYVDCVVGVSGSIQDDAARSFAVGFYGGLGARESVEAAYKQGRAAIKLEGLRDAERPRLKVRAGVDASKLILAAAPPLSLLASPRPAELIDFTAERQRHHQFVGREVLLARLDQLLIEDDTDRWVVVTGGLGMGKSALLAAWLARREAAGAAVPHHFIRRGECDWDDPAKLVGSLVAQIEARFPDQREPDPDPRMHPAARLSAALRRMSERELAPRGERLVLLIDGLDEYDPPAGATAGDPLAAFLPHTLPRGVSLACASRPRHPYVSSLEARDGGLVRIDLDDPSSAADNEATVRRFWERAAPALGLDARFVDEAVARAGGNLQHAVTLQKHLAGLPAEQRRALDIPRGLAALLQKSWARVESDPVVVGGLGILCAARGPLTLDELGAVAGWTDNAQRRDFMRGARELLVELRRPDGQDEYRLHHDSIRSYIAREIGAAALRGHHAALAGRLATWPPRADAMARRYALLHALIHRVEAGEWADAWRVAADTSFLEAKCRELGAHEAEADVARTAERCRGACSEEALHGRFDDLARALRRESHWLRAAPEATTALVWNRLRRSGWSTGELDEQLQVPRGASFLRVRHAAIRESPVFLRDLTGHSGCVNDCAVTADGHRVVSASYDGTLRVWDLESGRALATLEGHTAAVNGCAVTADGLRVVSASQDGTLKIWRLEGGPALATLEGHVGAVNGCAVTADGRVVSASNDGTLKIWDLEGAHILTTLEDPARESPEDYMACAVTTDGRRVISTSTNQHLKVWDLESGRVLRPTLLGWGGCTVTADDRYLVAGLNDDLLVWFIDDWRGCGDRDEDRTPWRYRCLEGHAGSVSSCAVTGDGRRAVSTSLDQTLRVWDLENGCEVATLEGHGSELHACAVTADGRRAISGAGDGTLKIWDLQSSRVIVAAEGHAREVCGCTVTADGTRAISASVDGTLKVWDIEHGCVLATLEGHTNWVMACAATADGQRLVSASMDYTFKVWDLETWRELATLPGCGGGWDCACAITADGQRVIVGAVGCHTLVVWDVETRSILATLEGHTGGIWGCAVTADDRRVVSASTDGTLKIWDLDCGRVLVTLEGHADDVLSCAVTASGRVVSASRDRTLKVWDLESGRALATLEGHTGEVWGCAVTVDGRHVVSASRDKTLKVWDLDTHACVFTHRGDAAYRPVAVTASSIVVGDSTGALWILDWPPSSAPPSRR